MVNGGSRGEAIEAQFFERFPYGLIVFDSERRVIAHNPAALRIVDGLARSGGPPTCCELLGCGLPDTALAGRCLTRTAASRAGALPEVRVELRTGRALGAAWVMAAPLSDDGSRVAVQLRPGELHDRRRGRVPEGSRDFDLRVYTFGRTRIEGRDGPVSGRWLDGKAGQILMYLLCERHRFVRTEEIMDSVWPGPELRTAGNVRYFVHTLRAHLEPNRKPGSRSSVVLSRHGGYGLDRSRVWVDADVFEERTRAGLSAVRQEQPELARHALEQAMEVYHGEFLAEAPYAEWALSERDRLRAVASDALRALAKLSMTADDRGRAIDWAKQLADLQPFDAAAQRQLLALMLAGGRRSDAVRHYAAFRERLAREFAEEPDFVISDVIPEDADPD